MPSTYVGVRRGGEHAEASFLWPQPAAMYWRFETARVWRRFVCGRGFVTGVYERCWAIGTPRGHSLRGDWGDQEGVREAFKGIKSGGLSARGRMRASLAEPYGPCAGPRARGPHV